MILCKDVVSVMNKIAPESFALDWDNVGLLVGNEDMVVNRILISLDLTDYLVDEAIKLGIDMIITHHPIFFGGIKRLSGTAESGRVVRLIKNDICLYCAHTNLDVADYGTNFTLFNLLGLRDMENFDELPYGSMGRVGKLEKKILLRDMAKVVKDKLGLSHINFYGNAEAKISKVALCTGGASGHKYFALAKEKNCDVYLTGDIKYHDVLVAGDMNLNLIDVTHFASETIFASSLKLQLEKYLTNVDIFCDNHSHDFFHVCA